MKKFSLVEKETGNFVILIDDVESHFTYIKDKEDKDVYIARKDTLIKKVIKDCSLKEISDYLDSICFSENVESINCYLVYDFFLKKGKISHDSTYSHPFIFIYPSFNFQNWNKPYTGYELQKQFAIIASNFSNVEFFEGEDPEPPFGLNIKIDLDMSVNEAISSALEIFSPIYLKTIETLTKVPSDVLSSLFQFPPEVKTACVQYLSYFSQFLLDLGIRANTSIKEEANNVLFTVMPEEGQEALERIKTALDIFLRVPQNKHSDSGEQTEQKDIAVIQYEATVYHLKSQLALAKAIMETKDATIDLLKLSNYKLQNINAENIIEPKKVESTEEKILNGIVTLKEFEGKGFSIDTAKLYRMLKRNK